LLLERGHARLRIRVSNEKLYYRGDTRRIESAKHHCRTVGLSAKLPVEPAHRVRPHRSFDRPATIRLAASVILRNRQECCLARAVK